MLKIFSNLFKFIFSFLNNKKNLNVDVVKKPTLHYLNDPTTPDLKENVLLPNNNFMPVTVRNMTTTGGSALGTLAWQAENAYISLVSCLNNLQKYFPTTVKKWAATSNLIVFPRAGKDPNAYYDRASLKFFYFNSYADNKVVYTVESGDIVTHELGHAILDAIRPDFWSAAAFEIGAFHESFGDLIALLNMLQYDVVLDKMMTSTGGNLRQNNFVSELAEQFGKALNIPHGLRNAFSSQVYVNPNSLPSGGNGLTKEVHSFSIVWTGAFYDLLVSIYEKLGKTKTSLIQARDIATKLLFNSIVKVPSSVKFMNSLAKCMIDADKKTNKGAFTAILIAVFKNRNILTAADAKILSSGNITVLDTKNPNYLFKNDKRIFITSDKNDKKIKVQLACDSYHCDDKNKLNALATFGDEMLSIEEAKNFVDYLYSKDLLGNEDKHNWFVDSSNDNMLTRRKVQCDSLGFRNNCTIEGQPEHGKCWKPDNNSGCCPYGCSKIEPVEPTIYKSCAVRYTACNNNIVSSSCNNPIVS